MFLPFAFFGNKGITTDGMIGWWDADDYTSGTTWVDRSANSLDLTLSGTYSKTTGTMNGGDGILFNANSYGKSPSTPLIAGSTGTEWTQIEITYAPSGYINARSTYAIGDSTSDASNISGYRISDYDISYIKTSAGGYGMKLSLQKVYNAVDVFFVARRFGYGELGGTTGGMVWAYGSSNKAFAFYTLTSDYNYISGGNAGADWNLGTSGVYLANAGVTSGLYAAETYHGAHLLYNRKIGDDEILSIYNYYKTRYGLL